MMKMLFNNCIIKHDGLQYILLTTRVSKGEKTKGQVVEDVVGYYTNEERLLKALIKKGLGSDAIYTIDQIEDMIEKATDVVLENV